MKSTLSGELSFYRFFSDQLTITMSPDHTGTVTSDYGGFQGTARFEAGNLYFSFEDRIFYYDREISEAFGSFVLYLQIHQRRPETLNLT